MCPACPVAHLHLLQPSDGRRSADGQEEEGARARLWCGLCPFLKAALAQPSSTDDAVCSLPPASHITFELYERTSSEEGGKKGFSLSIAISEGAHSPAILDSSVDARHSLNVQARKKFLSCVARRAVLSVSNVCPDPSSFLAWPQSHAL